MHLKYADGTTKGEDPDQTAPEQSDLGLHCLFSVYVPIFRTFYNMKNEIKSIKGGGTHKPDKAADTNFIYSRIREKLQPKSQCHNIRS